jgi:hypothetical protein
MKIVITESRRDRLAKQVLTDEFSGMYEDVNYMTDSRREHKTIEYRNGDNVIMIYGDTDEVLYICEDVTKPIEFFSYTPHEVKQVVGEWFSQTFELPVKIVQHVNKSVLN